MIIVEQGKGREPDANSYTDLESLRFHGDYFRYPIPGGEAEQALYLVRAAVAMNSMGWKGHKVSADQPLAWPRDGIVMSGEFLSKTLIPYGIRHGQTMLAIEMYAADQGFTLHEPAHGFDGLKMIPLSRSNEHYRLAPPLWVPSRTQFADYLVMRGLKLVN
ncbi:hypothetical protein YA0016_08570 [Pseudomonas syringae]|uniref:DnaT-like ssDNA-binding protein n=1 Tax=Pseudomonas syringae group TaxID=136849 RepID=UPI0006E65FC7|nr:MULTISPECIES: DnaT-like ssDNA-binding protein [Pseudomonas syringae group]AVI85605.1 hypothetical protein XJ28_18820 [Pseudomonas syringae pv. tomato]KPW37453.1 Uncharacterized protein ALO87_01147 [Pseudomonas syringae pv. apii]MBI6841784.1 hypothetical protein [Pseudomonas syringae]QBI62631.1 hypothetical protein EIZ61_14740 [Pseudomonas syringae]